jgi:hypothetical protein
MTSTASSAIALQPSASDLAFLRRVDRSTRRRTAGGLWGWFWRLATGARPRLRRYGRRAVVVLVLVTTLGGLAVATGSPAQANPLDPFEGMCVDIRKGFSPTRVDDTMVGSMLSVSWQRNNQATQPPVTKWMEYGTAGTDWDTFWLNCIDLRHAINMAADFVFWITKNIAAIAILLFMWTFQGDLLNIFLDPNQNAGGTGATLDDMISRVHIDVYLQLFSVGVLIGAVVLLFRFLRSAGGADILGKFALMVLVAGFALFYGGVPGGGGPHAAMVLKTFNDWTNDVTSVVLSAFAGTDCQTPTNDAVLTQTEQQRAQRRDMALQCAAEALYEVTIYTPWAVGELGRYQPSPRQPGGATPAPSDSELLAARILNQQAYSFDDLRKNDDDHDGDDDDGDLVHFKDARGPVNSINQQGDICDPAFGPDAGHPWTYTGKLCDRATMRQKVMGVDDAQLADESTPWAAVVPTNQSLWENWSGGQAGNRFQVAMLALIGSSSIALVIIIVSLTYLVLQIATIMFALMAPVAFLIGLIPGFGMKMLLRWLELLLGTFVKRIVLGLFVGLLMALYSVVLTIDMPWLMKLVLVCMIAAVGLIYRKKFTEAFAFNFSGSEAFHKDGQLTSDMAAAAVGGALGSRAAGGSKLGGAMAGMGRQVSPTAANAYFDGLMRQGSINARRQQRGKPYKRK